MAGLRLMDAKAPVFHTLGCRLNAYETEAMREMTAAAGLGDAVVVNTCAVTAEAVRKARQEIRKLRRAHPTATLIVTGCAAQTEPETFAAMPEVDRVIGNTEKMQPETWAGMAADFVGDTEKVQVDDIMSVTETAGHLIDGFGTRSRAYVQVQNGCDHRCTFCIIPYGRGNSRSVPAGVVVDQIKRLVGRGYNEVVLTGVDLTSWGADLPGAPRLGDLVMRISAAGARPAAPADFVDRLDRGRREPDAGHRDRAAADAASAPVAPAWRRPDPQADEAPPPARRRHCLLRGGAQAAPRHGLRADIIAGFPDRDRGGLRQFAEAGRGLRLTWLHVFPLLARPGTPAARMPQVQGATIKDRAARLRTAGEARIAAHLSEQIGHIHHILMENPRLGRTEQFTEVAFAEDHPEGRVITARISATMADT